MTLPAPAASSRLLGFVAWAELRPKPHLLDSEYRNLPAMPPYSQELSQDDRRAKSVAESIYLKRRRRFL